MTAQPRWLSDDEQHLWRTIIDVFRNVTTTIDDRLQDTAALSSPDFSVLVVLSEAENRTLRLRDLCGELGWDRSRTSHQVTRMEKRGLVAKQVSPGDARGILVSITDDGLTRLDSAAPDHVETVRRLIFDHLTDERFAALKGLLADVEQATSDSNTEK